MHQPQLHFNPASMKPMSRETQAKGEAFVQALIDEGHGYDSMKAAFLTCVVHKGLSLAHGVVAQAATVLKTHRNLLFNVVRSLKLRTLVAQIRAEGAAK